MRKWKRDRCSRFRE